MYNCLLIFAILTCPSDEYDEYDDDKSSPEYEVSESSLVVGPSIVHNNILYLVIQHLAPTLHM